MNRETWEIVSAKSHAYLRHSMFKNTLKNVTQKNAVLAAAAFVVVNTSMKMIKMDHVKNQDKEGLWFQLLFWGTVCLRIP